MSQFQVQIEVLTLNQNQIEFYGGYLLVAMEAANLPFSGIDHGFGEKESEVPTKYFSFYSDPIETNNTDFSDSIFYGFAGFQSPMGGSGECDTVYTAVYSDIFYDPVSSSFRFQISGNPMNCFKQILFRASAYWILFKRKRCVEPRFIFAGNYTYCTCINGTYEGIQANTQHCFDCDKSCNQCIGGGDDDCTQCKNNMDFNPVQIGAPSGKCECNLPRIRKKPPETYYCIYCYKKCQLCIDDRPQDCFQCYNNMTLVLKNRTTDPPTGECICIPGLNEKDLRCYGCHYSCESCGGTEWDECLTCKGTRSLLKATKYFSCPCDPGYYETFLSRCGSCNADCVTCTGPDKSDCLVCQYPQLKLLVVNEYEQSGFCGCHDGFYRDGQLCQPCDSKCLICSAGSPQACYRCDPRYQLQVPQGMTEGSCVCYNGYFETNTECQQCPPQCVNCISKTQCILCQSGLEMNKLSGKCECGPTFYEVREGECRKCPKPCETCDPTKCLKCVGTALPQLSGFRCYCPQGQYLDFIVCKPCYLTCKTCDEGSDSDCLTCIALRALDVGRCLCQDGYYEKGIKCKRCQYPCATCAVINTVVRCTSCVADVALRIVQLDCACVAGYFETGLSCQHCADQCLECETQAAQCTKCRYRNAQPEPNCLCLGYEQLFNLECVIGRNVTLFTYFNAVGDYQYIRIESNDLLQFLPQQRMLQVDTSKKIPLTMSHIDQLFNLSTSRLECPFLWQTISVGSSAAARTSIVLGANYTKNHFEKVKLRLRILNPDSIVNQDNLPLNKKYRNSSVAYIGPYQAGSAMSITSFAAEWLHDTVINQDPSFIVEIIRRTRVISLCFPTLWAITVIIEGYRYIPPTVFVPTTLAVSTLINHPPIYSLQQPYTTDNQTSSFSSILHNQTEFGEGRVVTGISSISPNLFRMNYTGIFLVDAADSLIAIGAVEGLTWMFVSAGTSQRYKLNLNLGSHVFRILRHQIYRCESYHIIKLTVLGLSNIPSDANLFEITSVLISVLLSLLILKEIFKALLYGMHFHQALYRPSKVHHNQKFLGYAVHLDEEETEVSNIEMKYADLHKDEPPRPIDYLPYTLDVAADSRFKLAYHAIAMFKRVLLGVVVGAGVEERPLMYTIMGVEIAYILLKLAAHPYRHWSFYIKLLGDCLYLAAVCLLLFAQDYEGCEQESNVPFVILILFMLFILFYLLSLAIVPLLNLCAKKKKPVPQVEAPPPEPEPVYIPLEPEIEEPSPPPPPPPPPPPQKKYFQLSKAKMFSYSKLFNNGVLHNSNLMKIEWWSEMIKSPDDIDSCGVKYVLGFFNKSDTVPVAVTDVLMVLRKFEQVTGSTEMPYTELQPGGSEKVNIDCIMDLASLDIYDDRLIITGEWFCELVPDAKQIDFALCTSELKIIDNWPVAIDELDSSNMYMTFEHPHFEYDPRMFEMMKELYKFMDGQNYITKMCTHFHKYPRLYYYLELDFVGNNVAVKIIAHKYDQDLISNSGYQQVIEHYGMAVVDFLGVEKVLQDGLQ